MADYRVTIRTVRDGASEPAGAWVVDHHLTPRAAIEVDTLSGGHLLHLAVAGCLFNDLLREAPERGIGIDHLAVSAEGDLGADGSGGVRYAIEIRSPAGPDEVGRLLADVEAKAIIPRALRAGTAVERAEVVIVSG